MVRPSSTGCQLNHDTGLENAFLGYSVTDFRSCIRAETGLAIQETHATSPIVVLSGLTSCRKKKGHKKKDHKLVNTEDKCV